MVLSGMDNKHFDWRDSNEDFTGKSGPESMVHKRMLKTDEQVVRRCDDMGENANRERILAEHARMERKYRELNRYAEKGQTVMVGSSLMEWFPINELMMSNHIPGIVYNRGLAGYTTDDLLKCLDVVLFELEPSRVFMNIGSNDIGMPGDDLGHLLYNYREILRQIRDRLPECQINILAYYPVAESEHPTQQLNGRSPRTLEKVCQANQKLKELANELELRFIDLNHTISDARGYLRQEFAMDPIHMWPSAYQNILEALKPYILE